MTGDNGDKIILDFERDLAARVAKISGYREMHRQKRIETARSRPITDKIDCGVGWIPTIVDFVTAADKHPDFVLIHAGEKWGLLTLDYHVDVSAAVAVRELVQEAIEDSSRTCEVCGADGHLRLEGWRKTLCDRHALDRRVVLTEDEHETLMQEFSASQGRWRPVLERHRRDVIGSDQLFESFMKEFEDLDAKTRRFWSMNLTRIILARREGSNE